MNIFILTVCALSLIGICLAQEYRRAKLYPTNTLKTQWSSFKLVNRRSYKNSSEETRRYKIFKANLEKINNQNEKFNLGQATHTFGVNQFSDMTSEEFLTYVNKGLRKKKNHFINKLRKLNINQNKPLPVSIDWRSLGFVNRVKDQGICGCCWVFSAVSALESYYYNVTGKKVSFSEQQLVDCVYAQDGCNGGLNDDAFNFVKSNGIVTETNYQYSSGSSGKWNGKCTKLSNSGVKIAGFVNVITGSPNEMAITNALANIGPLSVYVYATDAFQLYESGVFTDDSAICKNTSEEVTNHAVNLVGYGNLNGQDYYILRNQWGNQWGINGYMLFRRNNNNMCGIASYGAFPLFK